MFYKNIKILIFTSLLITLLNINIARVVAGNFLIKIKSSASEVEGYGKYIDSLDDFSIKLDITIKSTKILCGTFKLSSNTRSQDNKATLSYSYSSALSSPPEECSHAEILLNIDDLSGKKIFTSQQISLLNSQEQSIDIDEITSSSIQCSIKIADKHEDNLPGKDNPLNEDNLPDEDERPIVSCTIL